MSFSLLAPYVTLQTAILLVLISSVLLYYYKFRGYKIFLKGEYDTTKKKLSKALPAFMNGWFVIGSSTMLKNGDVVNIDKWGENIALFRGHDGILYALEAYCQHMGANLAIEGKVKNENCLQCPFHGWTYSGATGHCVGTNPSN